MRHFWTSSSYLYSTIDTYPPFFFFLRQDDEEEDDGDTYEAPPCERQSVTVPQSEVEENVYLGNEHCTESLLPTENWQFLFGTDTSDTCSSWNDVPPCCLFCREPGQTHASTEAGRFAAEADQSLGNNSSVAWKSVPVCSRHLNLV